MLIAANVPIYVLPEHVWSKVSPKAAGRRLPHTPPIVGSGPFQCVAVHHKAATSRLVANKGYWGGTPKVDEVIFQNYTNADTIAQEIKAGRLDACTGLLDAQLRVLKNSARHRPRSRSSSTRYEDLVFNCYVPPAGGKSLGNPVLRDWKFRQALQWAVDKEQAGTGGLRWPRARRATRSWSASYYNDPDWHWQPPADQAYSLRPEEGR